MTLRLAVGHSEGPRSGSWKLWAQGNEAYLLWRGPTAQHQKFSFHKSGNCHWAKIAQGVSGADRVTLEWERDEVAPAGSGQGSLLLSVAFPTNHLSAPQFADGKQVQLIKPAPPGQAMIIELFVTNENESTLKEMLALGGERQLIYCKVLRSGLRLCATASQFECGPVEINMPAAGPRSGAVFGAMQFPDEDTRDTGRPLRLIIMPEKTLPPTVWELGGYEVAKVTP